MPKHTQHTFITWIPDSADGAREARNLHGRFNEFSALSNPSRLTSATLSSYMSLIVVGHIDEWDTTRVAWLKELLLASSCKWLVMANCGSGASGGALLAENRLLSPAQTLANGLKIKVSGTTRDLTFDEVGKGYAFALTMGEMLIRSNYGSHRLWVDCEPQESVDEISTMLGNI